MVRQARRCASRGRRVVRERRSVALRPHLPKMFRPQRACEGGHVGGRTYVAIHTSFFFVSLRVDGRHQSMFAQSVDISIPPRARSIRVPSPSPSPLQARRHPLAPGLGSTAHRR